MNSNEVNNLRRNTSMVEHPNYTFIQQGTQRHLSLRCCCPADQTAVTSPTSYFFGPSKTSGSWQKAKASSWKKSNQKRGEHLVFEEICVAFTHFHPSEDGSIPSLFKRTPHHLGFTNSGSSIFNSFGGERPCAPWTEQTNPLQCDDVAEAAFLCYLAIFSLWNYFANAYIWTISIWKFFFSLFCTNTENLSTVLVLTRFSSQTRKLISITGVYPPPMLSLPIRVTSVMSLILQ